MLHATLSGTKTQNPNPTSARFSCCSDEEQHLGDCCVHADGLVENRDLKKRSGTRGGYLEDDSPSLIFGSSFQGRSQYPCEESLGCPG